MRIHHIGYLVKHMAKAVTKFKLLGYEIEREAVFDPDRQVTICFMVNSGYRVELICPQGKESPVYGLLSKYRNSPYHICYECGSLPESMETLAGNGFMVIQEPARAVALENRQVVFLMGADMGMIELLEV